VTTLGFIPADMMRHQSSQSLPGGFVDDIDFPRLPYFRRPRRGIVEDSASRRSNKVVGLNHSSSVSRLEVRLTRLDPMLNIHHFFSNPDRQPRTVPKPDCDPWSSEIAVCSYRLPQESGKSGNGRYAHRPIMAATWIPGGRIVKVGISA
jgi:hypothetical protein